MNSIIVTMVSDSPKGGEMDLELPADLKIGDLIPILVQALELPAQDQHGKALIYQLRTLPRHTQLSKDKTLYQEYVDTGAKLVLGPDSISSATIRTALGQTFNLDTMGKTAYVLGRSSGMHIPDIDLAREQDGDTVSRTHARLQRQGLYWYIVHLSQSNDTTVNGQQLAPNQPLRLESGNEIQVGQVRLTFTAVQNNQP